MLPVITEARKLRGITTPSHRCPWCTVTRLTQITIRHSCVHFQAWPTLKTAASLWTAYECAFANHCFFPACTQISLNNALYILLTLPSQCPGFHNPYINSCRFIWLITAMGRRGPPPLVPGPLVCLGASFVYISETLKSPRRFLHLRTGLIIVVFFVIYFFILFISLFILFIFFILFYLLLFYFIFMLAARISMPNGRSQWLYSNINNSNPSWCQKTQMCWLRMAPLRVTW